MENLVKGGVGLGFRWGRGKVGSGKLHNGSGGCDIELFRVLEQVYKSFRDCDVSVNYNM